MTAYERLAGRLRARRDDLDLTQMQVAVRAGVGESAIRALEAGRREGYRSTTLRAVSSALNWTPDSAERILDGDEAVEAPAEGGDDIAARVAALEAELSEVRRQLAERDASYPVNLDDPDEAELWALDSIPAADRWALVEHLRKLNAQRGRDVG